MIPLPHRDRGHAAIISRFGNGILTPGEPGVAWGPSWQTASENEMWPRTDLIDLLGITHPIIQAPMIGYSGPALVAAVSNAGALGSLPCAAMRAQAAWEQNEELRRASGRPFNLNFFVHPVPSIDAQAAARIRERLAAYHEEFGLGAVPEPSDPLPRFDEERLQMVLELRPLVVSFHFGLPPADTMKRIKQTGAVVLSSATTVAEARKLEAQGADAIIAQGLEAGGHRGTFTQGDGAGLIGTMALVPQVVNAVGVPVIAAGGIADGRGIAAAFALGASGVQLGTAYLRCPEAKIAAAFRAALAGATDESTVVTNVLSGRPARGIANRMTRALGPLSADVPPFPHAAGALAPLRATAEAHGSGDYTPLWAGQAVAMGRATRAAEL